MTEGCALLKYKSLEAMTHVQMRIDGHGNEY